MQIRENPDKSKKDKQIFCTACYTWQPFILTRCGGCNTLLTDEAMAAAKEKRQQKDQIVLQVRQVSVQKRAAANSATKKPRQNWGPLLQRI